MAIPNKGEVDFTYVDEDGVSHTYTFKFTNRGRRETETMLGVEGRALALAIDRGMGANMKTAFFFGATRKFHLKDFPSQAHVDKFMDDYDDLKEDSDDPLELEAELVSSLLAAYFRSDKERFKKMFKGEITEEDLAEEEVASENGSSGDPKDKKKKAADTKAE